MINQVMDGDHAFHSAPRDADGQFCAEPVKYLGLCAPGRVDDALAAAPDVSKSCVVGGLSRDVLHLQELVDGLMVAHLGRKDDIPVVRVILCQSTDEASAVVAQPSHVAHGSFAVKSYIHRFLC